MSTQVAQRTALRLVSTRGLDRVEWLKVRRHGIGSSDAAAAVGLSPYKSQLELWMEKTGRVALEKTPPDQDSPMYWGTLLEPYVATAYTQKTGRKVRRLNAVLQHPTFPYLLADIDREVIGCPEVQVLECKTAGEFGSKLWKEGVPEYVQLQVQHQLAVTGKVAADVAVLLCGQKLEVHRVQRDEDLIGRLLVLETRFWECVDKDTPPAADGSESAGKALRVLYRGADTTVDCADNAELAAKFAELVSIRDAIDKEVNQAEKLKQAIQQAMGDASTAIFPTGEISFKCSKDSQTVDVKRLTAEHPELVTRYVVTKPGTRRFRISTHE